MELLIIQYSIAIPLGLIFMTIPLKIVLIIKDSVLDITNSVFF